MVMVSQDQSWIVNSVVQIPLLRFNSTKLKSPLCIEAAYLALSHAWKLNATSPSGGWTQPASLSHVEDIWPHARKIAHFSPSTEGLILFTSVIVCLV